MLIKDFLRDEAVDAVCDAVSGIGDAKDAKKAVKAWAGAEGISAAEAWITLFGAQFDYAQEVVEMTLKISVDLSDIRDDEGEYSDDLGKCLVWDASETPDLSSLDAFDVYKLLEAIELERRFRRDFAVNAVKNASGDDRDKTLSECRFMTGKEIREMTA